MLEPAGLSPGEEQIYRALIEMVAASSEDIADRTGMPAAVTALALAALETKKIVSRTDGAPERFRAIPPDVALLPQLQQRAADIERAHTEARELLETYRSSVRRRDAGQLVEIIEGSEALRHHLGQIQNSASQELLWFCKAQYVAMPSGTNQAEFDALARGVRYRVLYERDFFNDAKSVENVERAVRVGETARTVRQLPLRIAIADRSVAIFPLVPGGPGGGNTEPTAALVRQSSLLEALVALFECYWERSLPLQFNAQGELSGRQGEGEPSLTSADIRLLSLLIAGIADKAIASQMGLSRRTLQRRIQRLMELAGSDTRMQLAWHAARQGWI
ncbi:helix-turn-helix domain-containing protein [Streptomyces sp. NBC_01217]|uniref:helix-turn-helix domain-containing protein n=1 Tax=Streptomyces sp. NBC_01217 TaxID=2903779 RepID=UPI002E11AACA|nr:TrmB family transcriptional regulator [Streptomyces sp. NBC_01217]